MSNERAMEIIIKRVSANKVYDQIASQHNGSLFCSRNSALQKKQNIADKTVTNRRIWIYSERS